MLKKIDHINIVVKNLEKTKNFFVDLGFIVQAESMLEGEWIDKLTQLRRVSAQYVGLHLKGSEISIELLKFTNPECLTTGDNDALNKTGFRHLAFEVEHIEKVVEKLKEKGIEFISSIQTYNETEKKLCYLKGPEGIVLELAEYKK